MNYISNICNLLIVLSINASLLSFIMEKMAENKTIKNPNTSTIASNVIMVIMFTLYNGVLFGAGVFHNIWK